MRLFTCKRICVLFMFDVVQGCVFCAVRACPGCAGRGPRRAAMAMPLRSARRAGIILQSTCHTKRVASFVSTWSTCSVFRFQHMLVRTFHPESRTDRRSGRSLRRAVAPPLYSVRLAAAAVASNGARPRAQCGHGLCAFIRVPRQSLRRMFRAPSRMPSPTSVHTHGSPRCGHRASAWHDAA